jgi:putative endonuclease
MNQQLGQLAEDRALDYLIQQGLQLVMRNYTCPLGEIDLIMKDRIYLVFIEVRSRKNPRFGGGIVSITYAKKQKILKTTAHYLMKQGRRVQLPLRFDVVSMEGHLGQITWIKDAFGADY